MLVSNSTRSQAGTSVFGFTGRLFFLFAFCIVIPGTPVGVLTIREAGHQSFAQELSVNKVRNALVANRSVFKLFLTELNPTILKIFHVSQSVTM